MAAPASAPATGSVHVTWGFACVSAGPAQQSDVSPVDANTQTQVETMAGKCATHGQYGSGSWNCGSASLSDGLVGIGLWLGVAARGKHSLYLRRTVVNLHEQRPTQARQYVISRPSITRDLARHQC